MENNLFDNEKLARIKNFFKDDIFATETTGIDIVEVGEGYAKCSMALSKKHFNAANGIMGGAIYTLADFSFAVATNASDVRTVTSSGHIQYLSGVKGDTLISEARMLKDGKRVCFYEIIIKDNTGVLVAKASMDGVHLTT
ncbi:MAG: PaaI family thioesterase [Lachnospiraceae bacterium]|nr:PaaI family thioesterase [Lachnospiraceae bacterium]